MPAKRRVCLRQRPLPALTFALSVLSVLGAGAPVGSRGRYMSEEVADRAGRVAQVNPEGQRVRKALRVLRASPSRAAAARPPKAPPTTAVLPAPTLV